MLSREWKTDIGPNRRVLWYKEPHSWYLNVLFWETYPLGCSKTKTSSNTKLSLTTSRNSVYWALCTCKALSLGYGCIKINKAGPWTWKRPCPRWERDHGPGEFDTKQRVSACGGGGAFSAQCCSRTKLICSFCFSTNVSVFSRSSCILDNKK